MTQSTIVDGVRKFNRFYINYQGLFNQHVYDSPYSLTEIRVLFEINRISTCTASLLQEQLGLDRGYVSRILKTFEKQDIIYKQKGVQDGRTFFLHLTAKGTEIYHDLESKANKEIGYLLRNLTITEQQKLFESMITIENILSKHLHTQQSVVSIRDQYTADDIELMIEKQRAYYADTHGFDETFLDYLRETFDSNIKKIWIAEVDGKFAGCIGLVEKNENTALLRWFIVEDFTRGKGAGTKLIQTLLDYCRETKYEQLFLETISKLTTARRLYRKFGFELIEAKEQRMWGQDIVDEQWRLKLI